MTPAEREHVRQELNSQRFVDKSPHQVYATLLDEGKYLCSVRTMYRILGQNKETRVRRAPREYRVGEETYHRNNRKAKHHARSTDDSQ